MEERDLQGRTPAEERADIGTPAGERPEEGRKRHGTEVFDPNADIEEVPGRKHVPDDIEDISDEDYAEGGVEIGPGGGITGTHVTGGIPAGGTQSGGTPGERQGERSGDNKK